MSRFQYFVASSLDGFIATEDEGLDWLLQFEGFEGQEETFSRFLSGVGCILMGGDTYRWMLRHDAGPSPFAGIPTFVFSHLGTGPAEPGDATILSGDVGAFRPRFLEAAGGKHVWVVGGGNLAAQCAAAGMLDDLILTVVPVVLGSGRRLLPLPEPTEPLELAGTRLLDRGLVELTYRFTPD
ncbi:dihydrofolate reductase family protein [Paenarthrobacter sp. DKR-5]|uniref:dihydrofolate reductase family protein n=1 Tax=Paenarthrobacter sp. DKR-5 TaxID=2835535 RepID=UPI001BDC372A|nr:dihydrofolate reductase family protein [Paenarthrobacter sp. DKR-5]MBT1001913.1 dihydrofolate reductase family protein [Paenarthrobacter sp. DKR-5]